MLKPQDIVIVMKILAKDHEPWSQALIAMELGMSASEVNSGIKRALVSGLLRIKNKQATPVKAAVEEFLLHGLKYAFPIESVPFAVKQDHKLYNLLAIIDVLRSGRAREFQLAKKMLHETLQA